MRKLLTLFLAMSLFMACNSSKFVIEGTTNDPTLDGKTVELKSIEENSVALASTTISSAKFKLEGSIETPDFYAVVIDNNPHYLFLEKGKIKMNIDLEPSKSWTKGTHLNDTFEEFKKRMDGFSEEMKVTSEKYNMADETEKTVIQNQFNEKIKGITEDNKKFVKENNNLVGAYVFTSLLNELQYKEANELYESFSAEVKSSPLLKGIDQYLNSIKTIDTGDAFVDLITMQNPAGENVSLSHYVGKGKYVLVDFWASWCSPCRIENPNMVNLYNKYKDKGFDIVGVSLDREDEKDKWLEAIKSDGLVWNHMSDLKEWGSEAFLKYKFQGIPYTILFDGEGKVVTVNLKANELDVKLAELLK